MRWPGLLLLLLVASASCAVHHARPAPPVAVAVRPEADPLLRNLSPAR